MKHYSTIEYKKEMLGYQGKLPRTWASDIMREEYPDLTKGTEEYNTIHGHLKRTASGLSYKKGVKEGYINLIRKKFCSINKGEKFIELPTEVISF